ncbi:phosphopantothenoylcysteine decarboxylase [Coraliomargarita akajimensis]|uniref:phosphopantothenoylcysteine decarboxylase domain-containing protein n=1 Tax=Coraliomargarita akajimensis TaxID=395922 RepID=UPI00145C452E|nr:phosphopantothenoylcysteine decarboxylase [Coraliomargarita akajimensis]
MPNASTIRCLITAGPTREFIDPVRFISNPSSGKMGFAIAEAAVDAGWTVDLVAGPVSLPEPDDVILYPVETAEEMFHQVDALFDACDVLIMTAAVSDFRPKKRLSKKEKKGDAAMSIEFERTTDILKTMTERKAHQTVVGFAAETNDVEAYARRKLEEKRCDWMVANDVSKAGVGFAGDSNEVLLIGADGNSRLIGPATKRQIADELVRVVGSMRVSV